MRKRSVPTTIVSSIIVVLIAINNPPIFPIATFLPLQFAFAVIVWRLLIMELKILRGKMQYKVSHETSYRKRQDV